MLVVSTALTTCTLMAVIVVLPVAYQHMQHVRTLMLNEVDQCQVRYGK